MRPGDAFDGVKFDPHLLYPTASNAKFRNAGVNWGMESAHLIILLLGVSLFRSTAKKYVIANPACGTRTPITKAGILLSVGDEKNTPHKPPKKPRSLIKLLTH